MGYSHALILTGVVHDFKREEPSRPIFYCYRRKLPPESVLLKNNKDIDGIFSIFSLELIKMFLTSLAHRKLPRVIMANSSRYDYIAAETKEKFIFRSGGHAIRAIGESLGLKASELSPKVILDMTERETRDQHLQRVGVKPRHYIVIGPGLSPDGGPNRRWPQNQWQAVASRLQERFAVLQIGSAESPLLNGCIDLRNLSVREAYGIIENSKLVLTYTGAYVHLAAAAKVPAIVLASGIEPRELILYPNHRVLTAPAPCNPCGIRYHCKESLICLTDLTVASVLGECDRFLV